ncbi:MAG: SH3 domain-containing protein [Cytophagales bacterium]|nr:MAG: SH3 domain-containing protein [Cytophagales bacterium]
MSLFDSMQALVLKKSLFIGFFLGSMALTGRAAVDLKRADSLFAKGRLDDAALLYEVAMAEGQMATDPVLLKMAYIAERNGDPARLLYFLQVFFERHPQETVLRKMNEVARSNNLIGYETDDLNYFYLFYKQYGIYLLLFLLGLGVYVFGVLVLKMTRKEPSPVRHKLVVLGYLFTLLLFVNLPEGYQSGITSRDRVLLRQGPSAASPVTEIIGRGHKVNILGSEDIWLRIFWNDQLYYIRKDQVWVI